MKMTKKTFRVDVAQWIERVAVVKASSFDEAHEVAVKMIKSNGVESLPLNPNRKMDGWSIGGASRD